MHHKLGEAQKEVWECRDRARDFFESVAALADKAEKGTGPICRNGPKGASHKLDLSPFSTRATAGRQPGIVANPLSERLDKLVATLRQHGQEIERPEERQDFTPPPTGWRLLPRESRIGSARRCRTPVYWIERGFSRSRLRISFGGADRRARLREHLFTQRPR